jgi:hypothetical protein
MLLTHKRHRAHGAPDIHGGYADREVDISGGIRPRKDSFSRMVCTSTAGIISKYPGPVPVRRAFRYAGTSIESYTNKGKGGDTIHLTRRARGRSVHSLSLWEVLDRKLHCYCHFRRGLDTPLGIVKTLQ